MNSVINAFGMIFSFLTTQKVLGIPLIAWTILTTLFTLLGSFLKGKK